jgi:hypothetical protein
MVLYSTTLLLASTRGRLVLVLVILVCSVMMRTELTEALENVVEYSRYVLCIHRYGGTTR